VRVKSYYAGAVLRFDREFYFLHLSKDRLAVPVGAYDKIGPKGDGTVREKLGPDALSLHLKPLWPEDRRHIPINEIREVRQLARVIDREVDGDGSHSLDPNRTLTSESRLRARSGTRAPVGDPSRRYLRIMHLSEDSDGYS
jgi:hypothetical protein